MKSCIMFQSLGLVSRSTIVCGLLALPLAAQGDIALSYGMGEATSKTRIEACTIAENLALKDALVNYNEKQYTSTDQLVCVDTQDNAYCNMIKEIDSSTSGTIRSVIDRDRKVKDKSCFIQVKVEVEPAVQLPASVESKRFYVEGDQIELDVKVGSPLYLHIFNLHEKGVDLIFPNRYNSETLIDDRFTFPSDGVQVTAKTGGKKESKETLLFLFTKQRQYIDPEIQLDQIKQLLESIPVTEKRLVRHNIVIRSI